VRLIWLKHNARLHILHLTTEAETHLFQNDVPLQEKKNNNRLHHLWFSDKDYERLGMLIKWNPHKTEQDKLIKGAA
jgi:dihydroorotase